MPLSSYTYRDGDLWLVLKHYGWSVPNPRSGWQTISCGFHEDRTPSCRVNNTIGGITCFSCGFKGDAVGVVREQEGCSWGEAYRICEEITSGNHTEIPRGRGKGGTVSFGKRNNKRGGRYVPARLRDR